MKKVLLHICCAGCTTTCIERLQNEGFEVIGFFYNPNIHPESEYSQRRKDLDIIKKEYGIDIIEAEYDVDNWFKQVKGYESEPEGGTRCNICFKMRLERTYTQMIRDGLDFFTTTLTISPHKNSKAINSYGQDISKEHFLVRDFKKQDGFVDSAKRSKSLNLYRQSYCGCVYSQNKNTNKV